MSSLQLGLALLGALVIAALGLQFLWQRHRSRPPKDVVPVADPLEPSLVREPHLGASLGAPFGGDGERLGPEPGERFDGSATGEPAFGAALDAAGGAVAGTARMDGAAGAWTAEPPIAFGATRDGRDGTDRAAEPTLTPLPTLPSLRRSVVARLDGLLDAIAPLAIEQPLSGEHVLSHLPATRRAGSKPVIIEGLDTETGTWDLPTPGRRYGELQAGVQLANRAGAINEIEYSEFVQKIQAFADGLGASPDFPDMLEAVARARELDTFASAHDAQLVMRLVSNRAAWSLAYVQQHAAPQGFVPGVLPGRLVLPSTEEGAPPVLVLQFDAQAALADDPQQGMVYEVSLAFDVPQTAVGENPFAAWCAAGQALSTALDATMQDDGGRPFSPAAFDAIGGELEQLYEALAGRELPAGSAAARRLFS